MTGGLALRLAVVERDRGHALAGIALDHDDGDAARAHDVERLAQQPAAADQHGRVERAPCVSEGAVAARAVVAQQQQAGAERGDAVGEAVHHEGLDRVEERARRGAPRRRRRRCRSVRGAARRRADPGRCSRAPPRRRARGARVASDTGVLPLKTTDAVDGETPACAGDVGDRGSARAHRAPIVAAAGFAASNRFDTLPRMDAVLTRSQFVRWRTAIFAIFLASGLQHRDVGVARARHQGGARTSTNAQLGLHAARRRASRRSSASR